MNTWKIIKYKSDLALYAQCLNCGFEYACSSNKRNTDGSWSFEQEITKKYNYCPYCGDKKEWNIEIKNQI